MTTLLTYFCFFILLLLLKKISIRYVSNKEYKTSIKSKARLYSFRMKYYLEKFFSEFVDEFFYSGLLRTFMSVAYDLNFAIML